MGLRRGKFRWNCECGHTHDIHQHFTRSKSCAYPGCSCQRYHLNWWHWIMDKVSS